MKRTLAWATVPLILWPQLILASNSTGLDWQSILASWSNPDIIMPRAASDGFSVTIESKQVMPGESTRVGIYIRNDVEIRSLVIPLILRSIDAGSFCTAAVPSFDHTARINGYLSGIYNGEVIWPEITNTWPTTPRQGFHPTALDHISPDFILFAKGRILYEDNLPAGDDRLTESG
jgi:hypothetical protein